MILKLRKILSVILILSLLVFSVSSTVTAQVVPIETENLIVDANSEYRINDKITGDILEILFMLLILTVLIAVRY